MILTSWSADLLGFADAALRVALLCLHNASGSGAWSVSLSAVLMATVLCLLGGTVPLKFSAYWKGTHTTASSDLIKLSFPKAITRSFTSDRIGVWCQNVCIGAMGLGVRSPGLCAVTGFSSGGITFFLWTSELSLIGGVSLSLGKKMWWFYQCL